MVLEQDGKEYVFTKDITLDVLNADDLVYIGIDASHYNEYVAGNYKDSMGNFGNLAGKYNVRTVELKTSDDLIAACSNPKFKALILTALLPPGGRPDRSPDLQRRGAGGHYRLQRRRRHRDPGRLERQLREL